VMTGKITLLGGDTETAKMLVNFYQTTMASHPRIHLWDVIVQDTLVLVRMFVATGKVGWINGSVLPL
jgi:hypothetical protein